MSYNQFWKQIIEKNNELSSLYSDYWHSYSNLGSWQFWVVLALLLVPLVVLYFTIDRTGLFELLFYGYSINVNLYGLTYNLNCMFGCPRVC